MTTEIKHTHAHDTALHNIQNVFGIIQTLSDELRSSVGRRTSDAHIKQTAKALIEQIQAYRLAITVERDILVLQSRQNKRS